MSPTSTVRRRHPLTASMGVLSLIVAGAPVPVATASTDVVAAVALTTAISSSDAASDATSPPVVRPGTPAAQPPSDAFVLFDGTSLDGWAHRPLSPDASAAERDEAAARWILDAEAGAMEVRPGSGGIFSTHTMGAAQVHIEFMTPPDDTGTGQGRGNSGVYLHGRYEVQVLDSFENETHPDGQCAAIYGIAAPMVNASRPPGEWQTYDIIFHPPAYAADTLELVAPGTITVFHNGVLVHDRVSLPRPTTAAALGGMIPVDPEAQPILYLQDHGDRVRYRNIWVRPIG